MPHADMITVGTRFGSLVVMGMRIPQTHGKYPVRCDCGTVKEVRGYHLRAGLIVSCGCYARERSSNSMTKHGCSNTRLYRIWKGMFTRCNNENRTNYERYGGRGISVCSEWTNFASFQRWASEHGYDDKLSIERKDNALGYSPENCTWATIVEQGRNKRNNINITAFGVTKCISAWVEDRRCIVQYNTLYRRIKDGWNAEKAITSPLGGGNSHAVCKD